MPRVWSRAGRVVLIEDITASDRPRLPVWRRPGCGVDVAIGAVLLTCVLLAIAAVVRLVVEVLS